MELKMANPLSQAALGQLFSEAHSAHAFVRTDITDTQIKELYDLFKWAPTAFNAQPARFIFVRSPEAKEKLKASLAPGNVPQVECASVTVIVAYDTKFYEQLPTLFPVYDAKPIFENNPGLTEEAAFRNSAMQGAYLITAARALGWDCGAMSGFDAGVLNAAFFPDGQFKVNFLLNIGHADTAGIYPRNPRLTFEDAVKIL
jgi:3-hydroxypropanoate dehydrogenase